MQRRASEQMIEYQRSEKYRADRGFSVTVAGLINMKPTGAFKPPKLYKVEMAANERQGLVAKASSTMDSRPSRYVVPDTRTVHAHCGDRCFIAVGVTSESNSVLLRSPSDAFEENVGTLQSGGGCVWG